MAEMLTTGLWRPDAKVICFQCHTEEMGDSFGWGTSKPVDPSAFVERERGEYELEAVCQVCGKKIWMMEKVALEQKVVIALKESGKCGTSIWMQQTGGMCSAAEVMFPTFHKDSTSDYEFMWITFSEEFNEKEEPLFYCGLYHTTGDGSGDTEEWVDHAVTFDEVLAWVDEQWLEYEKKIEAALGKW
jgi:hypothetical protein